jgi:hypothetical protein
MAANRRDFLKQAGAGLGLAAGSMAGAQAPSKPISTTGDVTVSLSDTTDQKAPRLPAENELSRRCLRMLQKWIPVGASYFSSWPGRPNCGHFFGGVHWYGQETASPAEALAWASTSPEYDEAVTGVSRAKLRQMVLQAVRYLAFTHDTGPRDCVRPAVGLGRRENCNTKWGERGKGFFRESQCGQTVAALGRICLLLRDDVDEETWMMVARIHADYAARFGTMPPQSGVYLNTQLEENGWTAVGLTACSLFLSRHRQARAWEAMARRWMFATCAAPQDAKDQGKVGASRVPSLVGTTFTILPDYWAENHGMVHPSYTGYAVHCMKTMGCQLRLWRRELPPELFWNRRRVYENLKPLTDGAGYLLAVQGMDWHHLPTVGYLAHHAAAGVLLNDPEAAALERRALRNTELRQQGNGGRLYDKTFADKAHDVQDPMIMREITVSAIGEVYALHRLFGPGPEPTPEEELERRLRGVRVFPHAGFVHHRHARGQTSLSWRNSIMALPLTREGTYTIAPAGNSWLGVPAVEGRSDSHRLVSVRVDQTSHGFAAALIVDRCQETLRQEVLLASLPDGRMLSWERFLALEDLVLQSLQQGKLRITNETFPLLGPNSRGVRRMYQPSGAKDYRGGLSDSPADDIIDRYGRPAWLNVDDRLGLRFAGPGETVYHNRHYHKPYHAIADELVLSRLEGKRQLRAGQSPGPLAALLAPEQNHADTPAADLCVLTGAAHTACLAADDCLAAANFAAEQGLCLFTRERPALVAAYVGANMEIKAGKLEVRMPLAGHSARLLVAASMLRIEGDVRIDTAADGRIYAANCSRQPASVQIVRGENLGKRLSLAPGDVKLI